MDTEFEYEGHRYRVTHLPAMTQFHVVRRLGPALVGAVGAWMDRKLTLELVAGPVVEALAHMSDADAEYVVHALLSTVSRKDAKTEAWASVSASGRMMFPDLDTAPAMLGLAVHSMRAQMLNYFPEPARAASDAGTGASGPPSRVAKIGS